MNDKICLIVNKSKNILSQRKHSPVASNDFNKNPNLHEPLRAKLDSGESKYFFKTTHLKFLRNVQKLSNGLIAQLPNNFQVQASHKATLKLHEKISPQALEVLIFPHLKNESLILIGQLCDDNCTVIFMKEIFL